jgi:hypothetical protein
MRILNRLWLQRRFVLVFVGLWLAAELAGTPTAYPGKLIYLAAGVSLAALTAVLLPASRFQVLSLLVALIPLRLFEEPGRAALARQLPWASDAVHLVVAVIALVVLARLAALAGQAIDRLRLGRSWFSSATLRLPWPREAVWRMITAPDSALVAGTPVALVVRTKGPVPGWTIELADPWAPGPVRLHETEREDGVFAEVRVEPHPQVWHGMGAIVSVLLEESLGATDIAIEVELQRPPPLALLRFWLDLPLEALVGEFGRAALRTGPARSGALRPEPRRAAA